VSHARERGGACAVVGSAICACGERPLPKGYAREHSMQDGLSDSETHRQITNATCGRLCVVI
jgi:hypothetical protein